MADNLQDDAVRDAKRSIIGQSLNEIASEIHSELITAKLDYPVFFTVPTMGGALLTFGSLLDPIDLDWECIATIVLRVVGTKISLTALSTRHLACAMAGSTMGSAELIADLGTLPPSP